MLIRTDDYFFYSLKLSRCYIRLDTVPRMESHFCSDSFENIKFSFHRPKAGSKAIV